MPSVPSRFCSSGNFERRQRALDLAVSIPLLVLCSPLFVLVAALVKVTSRGPVLYRAERVGQVGRTFRLLKFRSMRVGADLGGPGITRAGDPRVTPVGRLLRRLKLDELPQLVNVLRGELSLVGPRPEDPRYVDRYTPEQRQVLSVRPGITSMASVRYRNEESMLAGPDWEATYLSVLMPNKLNIELDYLKRRSLMSDLRVIWKTFLSLWK